MRMIYTHHPHASIALKEAGAVFVAIAIIAVVALFVLLFLNSDRGSGDSEFKNKNYWQDGADNYWEPSSPLALGNHALPIFHITSTYRPCPAVHLCADGCGQYCDACLELRSVIAGV